LAEIKPALVTRRTCAASLANQRKTSRNALDTRSRRQNITTNLANPNKQNKPDGTEVNSIMEVLIFLFKFVGLSLGYFALMAAGRYVLGRFENPPLKFIDVADKLAGTHLGRVRFLFLAAIVSFVLGVIYPGPPLLFDLPRALEPMRKLGYELWNGELYVPPPPPNYGTWFWSKAGLLYFGLLALYVLLALPNVLAAAFQAANSAWERRPKASTSLTASLLWDVACAFIAVLAVQLILGKRGRK